MDTDQQPGPTAAPTALYPRPAEPARQPKPSKLVLALQFLLGGIGGFALVAAVNALMGELTLLALAGSLVLSLGMLWLQILIHEAGHAIAGLLAGRRLIGAGIGPLRLERGTGGWHLRWGGSIRGLGGFAALIPDDKVESRRAAAAFILGGPLANLFTAAAALIALWLAPSLGTTATVALGAIAFCGAMLGIVNLLPFQSQGWHTDGHNLRELLRDTPAWRVANAQQCVYALAMAGVRPRDWPLERLEVPEDVPEEVVLAAQLLRMSWALDHGDRPAADAAAHVLAAAYPGLADGKRQAVAVMMASYAVHIGDADLLAAWRPLCEGGLLDLTPVRLWLDAEAAVMAGDADGARALSAKARAAMPKIHDPASVVVMGEYLDRLDEGLVAVG